MEMEIYVIFFVALLTGQLKSVTGNRVREGEWHAAKRPGPGVEPRSTNIFNAVLGLILNCGHAGDRLFKSWYYRVRHVREKALGYICHTEAKWFKYSIIIGRQQKAFTVKEQQGCRYMMYTSVMLSAATELRLLTDRWFEPTSVLFFFFK